MWLGDIAFDYLASPAVARVFVREFHRCRCDLVELIVDLVEDVGSIPRLPCEPIVLTRALTYTPDPLGRGALARRRVR
ncbi:hypothetical protein NDR87_34440 [Nocardia sp. CDC159]|uniref:Uncharacterized protein n=1 Tax=Nocardia pulmonis TaxID=2951408 RepID=A0A9X2ED53_9NOCA|nr:MULTISPECIES: hypothetical protein [Nocardia]MCM6778592.1 hypothetical protein [Nocardia pulmonis]MCM6791481.1 hypothetical protein [Nocardia sp. CDC159]